MRKLMMLAFVAGAAIFAGCGGEYGTSGEAGWKACGGPFVREIKLAHGYDEHHQEEENVICTNGQHHRVKFE